MTESGRRAAHHARTRARRTALQALYQWELGQQALEDIEAQFRAAQDMRKVDVDYFKELLHQVAGHVDELDAQMAPLLDRPLHQLGPVERAILRIGAYELAFRPELPWRVIIDEGIELAKMFGAEQSHRYVNGVLDKLSGRVRVINKEAASHSP